MFVLYNELYFSIYYLLNQKIYYYSKSWCTELISKLLLISRPGQKHNYNVPRPPPPKNNATAPPRVLHVFIIIFRAVRDKLMFARGPNLLGKLYTACGTLVGMGESRGCVQADVFGSRAASYMYNLWSFEPYYIYTRRARSSTLMWEKYCAQRRRRVSSCLRRDERPYSQRDTYYIASWPINISLQIIYTYTRGGEGCWK